MQQQPRTWFVTGCSSGLGRAMAEALANHTDNVVITARRVEQIRDLEAKAPDRILALALDIADEGNVRAVVAEALRKFGRIDVLVNNAGIGLAGAIEECSYEEVERVFRTNVFGTLNVLRAVLPGMRERRSGQIFTLSSVGGVRGGPGMGAYNGSKFALEGMMESLDHEVGSLGIKVTILEPGAFKTDFRLRSITPCANVIADYQKSSGKRREGLSAGYPADAGEPAEAAALLIRLVESEPNPPLRLPIGADCVAAVRKKLASVGSELEKWEHVSLSCGGSENANAAYTAAVESARRA